MAEVRRKGFCDEDMLAYAIAEQRAIITHNVQDFASLAEMYFFQGIRHYGIIVARQFEKGELLRRTLLLLNDLTAQLLADTLCFV